LAIPLFAFPLFVVGVRVFLFLGYANATQSLRSSR
jgi:hypothetical protein